MDAELEKQIQEARLENLVSEKRMHYAHMFMGYTGGALFAVLITLALLFAPRISSLIATGQNAAGNVNTATGIWANAATDQTKQVDKITTDLRTTIAKFNRVIIPSSNTLLNTANSNLGQSQQLLSELTTTVSDSRERSNKMFDEYTRVGTNLNTNLTTLNYDLEGVRPILDNTNAAMIRFNQILNSPSLDKAMNGVAETTTNAGKISGDFYIFEHKHLNPEPCTTKGCSFKRNVWPWIRGGIGLGSEATEVYHAFRPFRVRVVP